MLRLILAFLLFPFIVCAQKGYVDDIYSTVPDTILKTKKDTLPERRFFIKNFEEGEVFFADGTSKKGVIKFNGKLIFKNNKDDKQIKYDIEDIESFHVGKETYIVVSDFKYQAQRMWGDMKKEIGYLKRISEGQASIYFNEVIAATGTPGISSTTINYYLKLATKNDYILLPANRKKFLELMTNLFEGEDKLLSTLNNKNYKHRSIDVFKEVINEYNKKYN